MESSREGDLYFWKLCLTKKVFIIIALNDTQLLDTCRH